MQRVGQLIERSRVATTRVSVALLVGSAGLLGSVSGASVVRADERVEDQVLLQPAGVFWTQRDVCQTSGVSAPFCAYQLEPPAAGATRAGFRMEIQSSDGGTTRKTTFWQGRVVFDLSQLTMEGPPEIVSADLIYREQTVYGGFERGCLGNLTAARQDATEDNLWPTEELSKFRVSDTRWDVRPAINHWLDGSLENHGFVLKGFEDSAVAPHACVSDFSRFNLNVVFKRLKNALERAGESPVTGQVLDLPDSTADRVDGTTTTRKIELPSSTSSPKPLVNLTVSSAQVRGKNVKSGSDCDPGENTVLAVIKNLGTDNSAAFTVRLRIDGEDVADPDEIKGIDAGKEVVAVFEKVKIKKGDRTLRIIADDSQEVTEGDESNNVLELKVQCVDEPGS